MARVSFTTATTGQRKSNGRGNSNAIIPQLNYKIGEKKRWVIPMENGELIMFSSPIHHVKNDFVVLPKNQGGVYTTSKIRCMNPSTQVSYEEQLAIAKSGEECLYCKIARLEHRKMWYEINNRLWDSTKSPNELPLFENMSKEERKKVFEIMEKKRTVERAFYTKNLEDGETELRHFNDTHILVLEIEVDGSDNPVMVDGVPKYTPILMPASNTRIEKFENAVQTGLDLDVLLSDDLHTYDDGVKTVTIGWLDYKGTFPKKDTKGLSAMDLNITVVPRTKTLVNDALIADFESKMEKIIKDAEFTVANFFRYLSKHNNEKALEQSLIVLTLTVMKSQVKSMLTLL